MKPNLTLCLMTCGEETEQQCLEAIAPFRDKIILQEVRNVCPQITALNMMLNQVETEYLIPLDADMILNEDAYERICRAIDKFGHDHNWHSILFKLFDTFTQRDILALKLLRTSIVKQFPFRNTATPDIEHFQRLTDAGFTCISQLLVKNPIGKHVVQGERFCYGKYRDVYQTLRVHGWEWDSAVFMGGTTLMERAKKHFDFFVKRFIITGNKDYLWAIGGMTDGIVSPAENVSKNLASDKEYLYPADKAVDAFLNWYCSELERHTAVPFF